MVRALVKCAIYEYNNKKFLVGIYYWDENESPVPSFDNYRLLIVDESDAIAD